jgi:hypothetical protein
MFVSAGCIVADPPEYREPVRTRPLLEVYKASPATADIVLWSSMSPPVTFTIPVRSEDAGQPLKAIAFTDYGTSSEKFFQGQNVPASTYDVSRDITFKWTPTVTAGCHIFTVIVAHESSFQDRDNTQLDAEKAGDDAAIVSWWANINPPNNASNTLSNCPQSELPTL